MKIALPNEQAIIQEAMHQLSQTMQPSQMIVLMSRWWSDGGDYLQHREEQFQHETVDSLSEKILAFDQLSQHEIAP
ncbi:hypothetical protein [Spirulina major]|uniref:hypothetical protein n=1 Tax=Spirulina major TaxID=270636 RepID=UPI000932B4B3|nr:hypothetical protein [Spirulina major]